jgi:hypothetical protein
MYTKTQLNAVKRAVDELKRVLEISGVKHSRSIKAQIFQGEQILKGGVYVIRHKGNGTVH